MLSRIDVSIGTAFLVSTIQISTIQIAKATMHPLIFQATNLCVLECYYDKAPKKLLDERRSQRWNRRMTQQLSLRSNHDPNDAFPLLVLRNVLAQTVLSIFSHMEDFIFIMFCALAIGLLFPSIEGNVLQEIEEARKELELDFQQAVDRYNEVSGMR
jgi:hypothetical protein